MKQTIIVAGLADLDGEYVLDFTTFKNREWRDIKRLSGLRALEVEDALETGDISLLVACAAILLHREGKTFSEDVLWEAETGQLRYGALDKADDADPPASATSPDSGSETGSSGSGSSEHGEPALAMSTPNGSGTPDSDTGADLGRATFFSSLQRS